MTLLAVARLGRFTAAADALGINHSTVSRRLAALERSMGGRVLVRTPSGWEVSPLGQRALHAAEQVEEALTSLSGEDHSAPALSGVVRLGTPDAFAVHVATPAIAELQKRHPHLSVELISATQRARQNRSGLDLEIVVGKPAIHRATTAHVMDYSLRLYATGDYLKAHGTPAEVADLADHRLNFYVEAVLTIDDLDRATEALPPMRRGIASTNVLAHVTATLAGAGIGLLPSFVAESEPELAPVLAEKYEHHIEFWAVGREEALRNPAVQAVYAALQSYGSTKAR